MNRRSFLSTLAGIATTLGCGSASPKDPDPKQARIAIVSERSRAASPKALGAFQARLTELGYIEGQNLTIERYWADGELNRLPALMDQAVAHNVNLIFTTGTPAALAAKNATTTIPVVVSAMGDPLGTDLVTSLARPGGNLTGMSLEMTEDLSGKWLQVLQEAVPRLTTVAVIANPQSALVPKLSRHLEDAARKRGLKLRFIDVRSADALAMAFKAAKRDTQAALIVPDPLITEHRQELTALAANNKLPAMYTLLDFMESGGLIAYGVDANQLFRRAAEYVDKILRGANPGELPVEQATQYRLVINVKTAKTLGLTISQSLLLRADEVIR